MLIPAHDEAVGLAATLANVVPQLGPADRLLVVADNCTDDTAAIARSAGVEVIERVDTVKRGKGFALDAGVRALEAGAPEVVVFIDADVTLRPGSLDALILQVSETRRPAQGLYLLRESGSNDGSDLVSHLAFFVRNYVRPLGMARLGGPSPLFGSGMAFPWDAIRDASLASDDIVEDMSLGLDLAVRGRSALLCPDAWIDGVLPTCRGAAASQRRRWEHGHLRTIIARVPRMIATGLVRRRAHAIMLALDLCVPPIAFLAVLLLVATVVAGFVAALGYASTGPAIALATGLTLLALSLLATWARFRPGGARFKQLWAVPTYVARKLPMYGPLLLRRGERKWQRTAREPVVAPAASTPDPERSAPERLTR